MAFVVGSASVEIIPDFREAQRKITAFFAGQKNSVKVPLDFEVDSQAETKARTATARVNKAVTDDTRKSLVERELMYQRMFDQIARAEEKSAREAARTQAQAAKQREQLARDAARTEAQIAKEREQALRAEVRQREQALREETRLQEQAAKEYTQVWENLLREREREELAASKARTAAERMHAAAVEDIQRDLLADNQRRLREQEADEREAAKVRQQYLREEAKRTQAVFDEVFSVQTEKQQSFFRRIFRREDAESEGTLLGLLFGQTVATNAAREIRARSAFLATVLAATLIAGAPTFLAAATVVFGGLGLAATASSAEVKDAWRQTWQGVLADTRVASADFIQVHKNLSAEVSYTFRELRPAIQAGMEAAAPLVEGFGNSLIEATRIAVPGFVNAIQNSGPVMRGFGDLLTGTATGLNGMFDAMVAQAPAAGAVVSSLGDIMEQLLPSLGQILALGADLSSNVLPVVTVGFTVLREVLDLLAPVLPAIAAGFVAMKAAQGLGNMMSGLSTAMSTFAQNAAVATYNLGGFSAAATGRAAAGASKFSRAASSMADNVGKAAIALPALGIVISGIASNLQDATSQEDKWAQAILAGGQASADAYKQYESDTHWGQSIDEATGLASSWDDAKERANELRDSMSPLQLAQTLAAAAQENLNYATEEYGVGSKEARSAADQNREAQLRLAEEQRKVNATLRDNVTSAEAAKTAMEDYQKAVQLGDTIGAAEALTRYKEETVEAATEQRLLNRAIADTVPSSEAAKMAMDDYVTAMRNGDVDGATEALARHKEESIEATREQILLEAALSGASDGFNRFPSAATSAQEALLMIDSATGATTEQIDTAIQKIDEWRSNFQSIATDFVEPLDIYRRLLEAKSEDERKAAEAVAKNTVSSKDSWRDYLETTKVTLGELADALQKQIEDQANWRSNIVQISAWAGQDVAKYLADMGTQGVELVADMADGTSAEAQRMADLIKEDIRVGGADWTAEMSTQMAVLEQVSKIGGQDAAVAMAAELEAGTITVAEIARKYGINLAAGINPLLAGLGKRAITVASINTGAGMLGNLWEGGYTGDGGKYEPKGVVHGGEYVFTKEETQAAGVDQLAAYAKLLRGYATGGFVNVEDIPKPSSVSPYRYPIGDTGTATMQRAYDDSKSWMEANAEALFGGTPGSGGVGGAWTSLWTLVKSQIPQARINSTFRPGDPGAHGRNKAIDFGYGTGPGGAGSAGLASINRLLHDQVGANLYELIYDGIGDDRNDLKNGKPLTYSAATRQQHTNHVHAAVYDWGGALYPGMNLLMNNTGSTEYLSNSTAAVNGFRDMLGSGGGAPIPRFNVGSSGGGTGGTSGDMTSVTGFANYGNITVANIDELSRAAEVSKRASLAALGVG